MAIFTAIGLGVSAAFFGGSALAASLITPMIGLSNSEFNPLDLERL